jgi:hypothetical protein
MTRRITWGVVAVPMVLVACGRDINFVPDEKPPVAQPPGKDDDPEGEPPDWQNCLQGWRGKYSNLPAGHRYVTPRRVDEPMPTDPLVLDLWDSPEFEQFDASLDFGQNWWPVDEGLEEDPKYFAVYWQAWIRAWSGTTFSFLLGSSDDSWVYVNGAPIAGLPGIQEFERTRFDVYLEAGQYPIEVYYAHRASELSAMSFRVLGGDVSLCYPAWDDEPETP